VKSVVAGHILFRDSLSENVTGYWYQVVCPISFVVQILLFEYPHSSTSLRFQPALVHCLWQDNQDRNNDQTDQQQDPEYLPEKITPSQVICSVFPVLLMTVIPLT